MGWVGCPIKQVAKKNMGPLHVLCLLAVESRDLQFGKIDVLVYFIIQKFATLKSLHFSQFFW